MEAVRLDIGCGERCTPGFAPVDIAQGQAAWPLAVADASIEEIRASHVLEHFSHREVAAVLADWVRALKPGGRLRVAVPDFETIARAYLAGEPLPVQDYVMGGHVDAHDRHGCLFDAEALTEALRAAGLVGISRWQSEQRDCASLPISLNLQGYKPPAAWPKVAAVMSVPRLGFNDFWGCALQAFGELRIRVTKHTGAYWEQCLTRAMDEAIKDGAEWLLTLDYDSVFAADDVRALQAAALGHPQADAIAALQVHRTQPTPLLTMAGPDGENTAEVPREVFDAELVPCKTAHFGLTLLRVAALRALPRPWFHGQPNAAGEWSDGRIDPDIGFWRAWEAAGFSLYTAARVPIGHVEAMVRWPGRDMHAIYQHPSDYHDAGKPEDVWR
jgi:hypothetical protein